MYQYNKNKKNTFRPHLKYTLKKKKKKKKPSLKSIIKRDDVEDKKQKNSTEVKGYVGLRIWMKLSL